MGINLNEDRREQIEQILGARWGSFPIKYLGLPLSDGVIKVSDWDSIIKRVGNRIASWKGKLLSAGGRWILYKVVLTNLSLCYLSIFKVPRSVLQEN